MKRILSFIAALALCGVCHAQLQGQGPGVLTGPGAGGGGGGGGGVTSIIAGTGISVNQATGAVTVTNTSTSGASLTPGSITQANSFAAFNLITQNGNATWILAKADTLGTATAVELATTVSGSAFTGTTHGLVTGMSGLTAGTQYYLSDSSAGTYTTTAPTTAGHYVVPVFFAITTTSAIVNVGPPALIVGTNGQTIASGTAYTLTASNADVAFGTTSPNITLGAAGTYLVTATIQTSLVGATYAAAQKVTYNARRTNNTPADLSGTTFSGPTSTVAITTVTDAGPTITLSFTYNTANTNDIIGLRGVLSATPSVGSVTCSAATINYLWIGP